MESINCDSESSIPQAVSPWSCFNCRRRKYRCNRHHPCTHCVKSGLECSYPISGRMPTRQHGLSNGLAPKNMEGRKELLTRLRQLERFVEEVSTQHGASSTSTNTTSSCGCKSLCSHLTPSGDPTEEKLFSDFGKLWIDRTGSTYVGNEFWALLNRQIKSVRDAIDNEDCQSVIGFSHISSTPFFSSMQTGCNNNTRQPLPSQIPYLWQVYVEHVDPFIKILHVPSMDSIVRQSKGKFDLLSQGLRALMYAISLAAITSLDEIEVRENFNESKEDMTSWLLTNTERALSDAGALETTDTEVIKAFLIYLEMAGQHYGSRSIWTMAGVLIRASMSIGLHRDGSNFSNLSHFDSEMRRRLWWHICFLDHRVGQCDVPQLALNAKMFDTREPSNVNDADIGPDMTEEPTPRQGFTQTSYALAFCSLWRLGCKIQGVVPLLLSPGENRDKLQIEALEATENLREKILQNVFQSLEPETDLIAFMKYRVNALVNQMVLIIRHMQLFQLPNVEEAEPFKYQSFEASIKSIEDFNKWRFHPSSRQWSWHLINHNQWHAVCIIFAQLCLEKSWNQTSENAWKVAMRLIHDTPAPMVLKNPLKRSVCLLIEKARKRREEAFSELNLPAPCDTSGLRRASDIHDIHVMGHQFTMNKMYEHEDVTWPWIFNSDNSHPPSFDVPSWVTDAANTNDGFTFDGNSNGEQPTSQGWESVEMFSGLDHFAQFQS